MTTFQQAIDYVNSFVPVMYPGSDFRYAEATLMPDARIAIEGVRYLLEHGYKVDSIPPTGREPVAVYQKAERELEILSIQLGNYQNVTAGSLNIPAGRVYMAMLDNPPKDAPNPSDGYTQADLDAAERKGYERCKADVARLKP